MVLPIPPGSGFQTPLLLESIFPFSECRPLGSVTLRVSRLRFSLHRDFLLLEGRSLWAHTLLVSKEESFPPGKPKVTPG